MCNQGGAFPLPKSRLHSQTWPGCARPPTDRRVATLPALWCRNPSQYDSLCSCGSGLSGVSFDNTNYDSLCSCGSGLSGVSFDNSNYDSLCSCGSGWSGVSFDNTNYDSLCSCGSGLSGVSFGNTNYDSLCSCGSGLSGEVLTDEGHYWVGFDISQSMLGKHVLLV